MYFHVMSEEERGDIMEKTRQWTTTVDPQTKAARYGIASLTDAELLALVISWQARCLRRTRASMP